MTTDQKIALVALLVAALTAIVTAVAGIRRVWSDKRGLQVQVTLLHTAPFYIYRVLLPVDRRPAVIGAAGWARLTIHNLRSRPALITALSAGAGKIPTRPIIEKPFLQADLYHTDARVSRPVELPVRLDEHSGLDCWMLIEFPLPRALGEVLFELYGDKAHIALLFSQLDALQAHLRAKMTDIKFVQVGDVTVKDVTVQYPLIRDIQTAPTVDGAHGLLPVSAGADVLNYLLDHEDRTPAVLAGHGCDRYSVAVTLGPKRVVRRVFRTKGKPLWFLSRNARSN